MVSAVYFRLAEISYKNLSVTWKTATLLPVTRLRPDGNKSVTGGANEERFEKPTFGSELDIIDF